MLVTFAICDRCKKEVRDGHYITYERGNVFTNKANFEVCYDCNEIMIKPLVKATSQRINNCSICGKPDENGKLISYFRKTYKGREKAFSVCSDCNNMFIVPML